MHGILYWQVKEAIEIQYGNFEGTYVEVVQAYVTDTGLSEFDYEA